MISDQQLMKWIGFDHAEDNVKWTSKVEVNHFGGSDLSAISDLSQRP
jgi:hypothetical protein